VYIEGFKFSIIKKSLFPSPLGVITFGKLKGHSKPIVIDEDVPHAG